MRETYGTMPMTKPEGMLKRIHFPELALMGVKTGDGRLLAEDGRGVRDLPRTIYGQFQNAEGHSQAPVIGTLYSVTFEDGVASGDGWVLDDDNGRDAVKYVKTKSLRHNSVDLAEVKAEFEYDEAADEVTLVFTNWKIAATTLVGKPAFANAAAEILEDDELVASWMEDDEPLIVDAPLVVGLDVIDDNDLTADAGPLPSWELFHAPEPDKAQKLTVGAPNEDGFIPVTGHLALWNSCHDGVVGRCTTVPRPDDDYRSYNKPGVLTDRGIVGTGPIFLNGGHRKAPDGDYVSAYGGIENAWADVRVTAGKLGPWLSGYVRPGVEDSQVLSARASRISGHWKGRKLKAIVSVNAEGFDVPGDGFSIDSEGHIDELVASLGCVEDEPADNQLVFADMPPATVTFQWPITATGQSFTTTGIITYETTGTNTPVGQLEDAADLAVRRNKLRLALAFDEDDE